MSYNKIIGYVLLVAGVLLISMTLYHSYNIFTGISQPPLIFKTEAAEQSRKTESGSIVQDLQNQIAGGIAKQISQAIPSDSISKALNLFSWSTFAWLIVFAGAQISGLGIKMAIK